jgi:hypothetical protein
MAGAQVYARVSPETRAAVGDMLEHGLKVGDILKAVAQAWSEWPDKKRAREFVAALSRAGATAQDGMPQDGLPQDDGLSQGGLPQGGLRQGGTNVATNAVDIESVRAQERERVLNTLADRLLRDFRAGITIGLGASAICFNDADPAVVDWYCKRWLDTHGPELLRVILRDQKRMGDALCGAAGQLCSDPSQASAWIKKALLEAYHAERAAF